jgi:hypothetical protein
VQCREEQGVETEIVDGFQMHRKCGQFAERMCVKWVHMGLGKESGGRAAGKIARNTSASGRARWWLWKEEGRENTPKVVMYGGVI